MRRNISTAILLPLAHVLASNPPSLPVPEPRLGSRWLLPVDNDTARRLVSPLLVFQRSWDFALLHLPVPMYVTISQVIADVYQEDFELSRRPVEGPSEQCQAQGLKALHYVLVYPST